MKIKLLTITLFVCLLASAQSVTPNLGLQLPAANSLGWGTATNSNWSSIDALVNQPNGLPRLDGSGHMIPAQMNYALGATGSVDTPIPTVLKGRASVLSFSGIDPTGIADSAAGLQAAFNYSYGSHYLYIPCGTYLTSAKISLTPTFVNDVTIDGESRSCAVIKYTGGATDYAVKVGGGGASIRNLTVIGNSNVSVAALGLFLTNSVVSNVAAEDANSTTGAGIEINNATGSAFYGLVVNTFISSIPHIGIAIDGQTTQSTLYNPTVQNIQTGSIGIKISGNSYSNSVLNAQFDCVTCVDTEDTSNASFYDSLFEQVGGFPGNVIVLNSSGNQFYNTGADVGPVVINAGANKFVNGTLNGPIQIASGATSNIFQDMGISTVSDLSAFTVYRNNTTKGTRLTSPSVPAFQSPYNYGTVFGTTSDFPVALEGSWGTVTANVAIPLSTMPFTTGKAWKAQFIGSWVGFGGNVQTTSPGFVELSDTNNTLTLNTVTYTFTVDATSHQFSMATSLNQSGFIGRIFFEPNSSVVAGTGSTVSANLQGSLAAKSISTSGSISAGGSISGAGLSSTTTMNVTSSAAIGNGFTQAIGYLKNSLATGSGHAGLSIDKGASSAAASVNFLSAGTSEWDMGIQTDNNFHWRDAVNSFHSVMTLTQGAPAGSLVVNASGATVSGGGVQVATTVAQPTCAVGIRGELWVVQGAAGVKDQVSVCAKDATDAYAWRTIY